MRPIREWQDVDRQAFESDIRPLNEPAVLRGLADAWPIVARARESAERLAQYIARFGEQTPVKAFVGDHGIGGRFFYSDDLLGFNFDRREFTLGELLTRLVALADEPAPESIYAGAIPLCENLAALAAETRNPLLDPAVERLTSIWIGNRARTAPHWDLPQNIAVVAGGERSFTLFPPEELPNLYVGPLDVTLAGQPVSLVDLKNPDFEKFPRFRQALAHAQTARLAPGDAIYIPSMWFHHVESHDALGVLVNDWWRDAEPYMFTPLLTLLHGLLSIRDLPEREREIWRGMFDHYLFGAGGEPMAHVPEEARSVYRKMTPERVAGLRAYLLRSLGGVRRDQ